MDEVEAGPLPLGCLASPREWASPSESTPPGLHSQAGVAAYPLCPPSALLASCHHPEGTLAEGSSGLTPTAAVWGLSLRVPALQWLACKSVSSAGPTGRASPLTAWPCSLTLALAVPVHSRLLPGEAGVSCHDLCWTLPLERPSYPWNPHPALASHPVPFLATMLGSLGPGSLEVAQSGRGVHCGLSEVEVLPSPCSGGRGAFSVRPPHSEHSGPAHGSTEGPCRPSLPGPGVSRPPTLEPTAAPGLLKTRHGRLTSGRTSRQPFVRKWRRGRLLLFSKLLWRGGLLGLCGLCCPGPPS